MDAFKATLSHPTVSSHHLLSRFSWKFLVGRKRAGNERNQIRITNEKLFIKMPQLYAFINNGAKRKTKNKGRDSWVEKGRRRKMIRRTKTFALLVEMKSETLISLQSNSIVSSGFNRAQWCKIIRSRSQREIFGPRKAGLKLSEILDRLYYWMPERREQLRKKNRKKKSYYRSGIIENKTGNNECFRLRKDSDVRHPLLAPRSPM